MATSINIPHTTASPGRRFSRRTLAGIGVAGALAVGAIGAYAAVDGSSETPARDSNTQTTQTTTLVEPVPAGNSATGVSTETRPFLDPVEAEFLANPGEFVRVPPPAPVSNAVEAEFPVGGNAGNALMRVR